MFNSSLCRCAKRIQAVLLQCCPAYWRGRLRRKLICRRQRVPITKLCRTAPIQIINQIIGKMWKNYGGQWGSRFFQAREVRLGSERSTRKTIYGTWISLHCCRPMWKGPYRERVCKKSSTWWQCAARGDRMSSTSRGATDEEACGNGSHEIKRAPDQKDIDFSFRTQTHIAQSSQPFTFSKES